MILIIIAVLVSIHAFMYGRWLKNNGNSSGALFVLFIVAIAILLPIYQKISSP